jgi:hypothetical protein
LVGGVGDEPALAQSGLTLDNEHPAASRPGGDEQVVDLLPFGVAPNHDRAPEAGGCAHRVRDGRAPSLFAAGQQVKALMQTFCKSDAIYASTRRSSPLDSVVESKHVR